MSLTAGRGLVSQPDRNACGWLLLLLFLAFQVGCGPSKPAAEEQAASRADEAQIDSPRDAFRRALRSKEWQAARELGLQALIASPNDPELLAQIAAATAMCGSKREAAQLLAESARAANFEPASRVNQAVQAFVDVGEIYGAIELLQQSLEVHPENGQHRRILVGFLGEAQRYDLLMPHYRRVVQERQFDLPLLIGVTDASIRRFWTKTAESLMQRNPDDHRVRLGEAQTMMDDRDIKGAEKLLREILVHHPDFAPAPRLVGAGIDRCGA